MEIDVRLTVDARDALDILLEKGHISTDSEALVYKVTSKETTNIYPMDIDW